MKPIRKVLEIVVSPVSRAYTRACGLSKMMTLYSWAAQRSKTSRFLATLEVYQRSRTDLGSG